MNKRGDDRYEMVKRDSKNLLFHDFFVFFFSFFEIFIYPFVCWKKKEKVVHVWPDFAEGNKIKIQF